MAVDSVVDQLGSIHEIIGFAPGPPGHQGASGERHDTGERQRGAQAAEARGRERVAGALPRRLADRVKGRGQRQRSECGKGERQPRAQGGDLFEAAARGYDLLDGINHGGCHRLAAAGCVAASLAGVCTFARFSEHSAYAQSR